MLIKILSQQNLFGPIYQNGKHQTGGTGPVSTQENETLMKVNANQSLRNLLTLEAEEQND